MHKQGKFSTACDTGSSHFFQLHNLLTGVQSTLDSNNGCIFYFTGMKSLLSGLCFYSGVFHFCVWFFAQNNVWLKAYPPHTPSKEVNCKKTHSSK